MRLASPNSAILSAVIFNAVVIIALIPLASARGAVPRAGGGRVAATQPAHLWARCGIIVPFIGIKAIDLIVGSLHLV